MLLIDSFDKHLWAVTLPRHDVGCWRYSSDLGAGPALGELRDR